MENKRYCESIAKEIQGCIDGHMRTCPECNEWFFDDEIDENDIACKWCKEAFELDEAEPVSLYDYFADCYDIEYRVGIDKGIRSVCAMVACGGPNIYVDTGSGDVELYWGGDRARYPLTSESVAAIDDYFADIYNCL